MVRRSVTVVFIFFLPALFACNSVRTGAEAISGPIAGKVEREGGAPVSDAWVVLVETAKRAPWTLVPIADRMIAKTITDENGQFVLEFAEADRRRLTLSVVGEPRKSVRGDGTIVSTGTDVARKGGAIRSENMIVVPNDFEPAK